MAPVDRRIELIEKGEILPFFGSLWSSDEACKGANGARGRIRTADTVIFSHVLYQLSYPGKPPVQSVRKDLQAFGSARMAKRAGVVQSLDARILRGLQVRPLQLWITFGVDFGAGQGIAAF